MNLLNFKKKIRYFSILIFTFVKLMEKFNKFFFFLKKNFKIKYFYLLLLKNLRFLSTSRKK
jgi:hypothetical protein